MATGTDVAVETFDLATRRARELNARLHALAGRADPQPARWRVSTRAARTRSPSASTPRSRSRSRATWATTAPA